MFLDLFISTDSLHVSGGSSAHHKEHKTVHTASGIVNQYCCYRDATFLDLFISTDFLHVSGGTSAHHQERITVHTALDIVNQYCC